MLTHESLRKFVNNEKDSKKLAEIPETFFDQAKSYIQGKEKLQKDDNWEVESAKRLLQDLLETRERKLLLSSIFFVRSGIPPENMTSKEEELFDNIVSLIKNFHSDQTPEKVSKLETLENIPEFVAPDMKTYGPFDKGQIIEVPKEIEELFIKKCLIKRT